jgi:conjugal transfer mating pair stabilization protein TraN
MKTIASLLIMCLAHNSVASVYLATSVLFFTPFSAIADAFIDQANDGKNLGGTLRSDFVLPEMDAASGTITLKNGAVNGQTVGQNELFQEVIPGSMDAAVAAYGNSDAMSTHINDKLDELGSSGTSHGMAYQTLLGANTAMPNMKNDPIWQTSDNVLGQKSSDINDKFTGCQKNSTFSEKSCSVHVKDLKTCKKAAKADKCHVTRNITYSPVIRMGAGDGRIASCGAGCTYLYIGTVGDNYWSGGNCTIFTWTASFIVSRPDAIRNVTIDNVQYDDQSRIHINDNLVYTGRSGYDTRKKCDSKISWVENPSTDVTNAFKNISSGSMVTVRQQTRVGGFGEGFLRLKVQAAPDVTEQFTDWPVGCRGRVSTWWSSRGQPLDWIRTDALEDQASTDWWQCLDAAHDRLFGGVLVSTSQPETFSGFGDILPEPLASPPAPICYSAETRVPGHVKLPCFTDLDGYQQCPEFDYNTDAHDSCESFAARPQCGYVGEQCADGAYNPFTGACQEFIITYDCGITQTTNCGLVKTTDKTICDSEIRCIGGECVDPAEESSRDFTRVAAALQTLNQAQQSNGCDVSTGTCKLFEGEALSCQMADLSILGKVDCCNMPIEGSWIDYLNLGFQTWELADTSVEAYALAEYGSEYLTDSYGAWNLVASDTVFSSMVDTITETWDAVTEPFTSAFDSVTSMLGEQIGTDLGIEAIKSQVIDQIGQWVASTFSESVASTLFSTTTTTAGSTAYTGLSSTLSGVFTVIGIVYAIYNIAKLVVQLIFACTEEEAKLDMLRDQRLCTSPTTIGTYCSADFLGICLARREAYCCFSSAFGRVFQEQARPQLGKNFGTPRNPECSGLTVGEISHLNFDAMDFGEWIGMLQITGHLPNGSASADAMYDKSVVTKSKLVGVDSTNTQQRLNKQTQGTDVDEIRQHLLDNL